MHRGDLGVQYGTPLIHVVAVPVRPCTRVPCRTYVTRTVRPLAFTYRSAPCVTQPLSHSA